MIDNSQYDSVLKQINNITNPDKYLVLGSYSTLAYTAPSGYSRQMNDLDLVMDSSQIDIMKNALLSFGYSQSTFINKRMPFYSMLNKHAEDKYLRFSKGDLNVEILTTLFDTYDGYCKFELFPKIWIRIPEKSIVTITNRDIEFRTLEVNLLWAIKQFLNNTLGRVMHYKKMQRTADLKALRQLVNVEEARKTLSNCSFGYANLSMKIPGWI